jgi:hypothetical protein
MRIALALALPVLLFQSASRADGEPARPSQAPSRANPAARCLLRVVHALAAEGGVDPQLQPLKSRLQRPPFVSWKTFHLVSQEERELHTAGAADYALPGGRTAHLTYTEHAVDARGKHVVRGALELAGGKSRSRTTFALDEGGLFLVAGEKHADGILIYALSCKTED